MLAILVLSSLALALDTVSTARPVTIVDANAPSNPCRAFGHTEVLIDPATGMWTPRTDCVGNRAKVVITDSNVKTVLANATALQAHTAQQIAFNQATVANAKAVSVLAQVNNQSAAELRLVEACIAANVPNVRCTVGDATFEVRSTAVGVADAENTYPNYGFGYGGGLVGTGDATTIMALEAMNGWSGVFAGQNQSGTASSGQKSADKPKESVSHPVE
jgi:hypothetical protein